MFLFKLYCQAKLFYNSNELLWDKVSGLCIDFESDLYINEIFFCFSSNLNKVVPNWSTWHLEWEMGSKNITFGRGHDTLMHDTTALLYARGGGQMNKGKNPISLTPCTCQLVDWKRLRLCTDDCYNWIK